MKRITTGDFMHVHGGFGAKADYTVRLTVRMSEDIDPGVLQIALEKTQQRYPYLSVRIRKDEASYYYEENAAPVVLLPAGDRISLNTKETNFHVWAVCFSEDFIHLDFYHGIGDGSTMYHVLSTLLYYYCSCRYGAADKEGIRTLEDPVRPEEIIDPQDLLKMPDPSTGPAAQWKSAFTLETDGGLTPSSPTLWDVEIPEDAFIRFTSAHDASPGTMISLLFARAVDSLYPEAEKDIISAYVINARPMLEAEYTHHNCLSMAVFDYEDRIKAMPLTRQCTVYRGKTMIQSDERRVLESMAQNAAIIRRTAQNTPAIEEKKQIFGEMFNGGEGYITFLVSYTGRWKHPVLGGYMREFWTHPPNTFSLMAEIGAVNGNIFLSIQQRFREDVVREAFLKQLEENRIPYTLRRVMESDIAHFPEPE